MKPDDAFIQELVTKQNNELVLPIMQNQYSNDGFKLKGK